MSAIYPVGAAPLSTFWAMVQILHSGSDISAGGWTPSAGGVLWDMLDEAVPSDSDYITTSTASTCEVAFGAGLDPLSSIGHTVRYRAKGDGNLTVSLIEGTTTIASHVPAITSTYGTFQFTLTDAEANSITNYANLRLRFVSS